MRKDYLNGGRINTIYFGGGTPSQLSIEQLSQIIHYIYNVYDIVQDAEITIEINPDDVCPDFVYGLRQLPFNRISLGIQSFNESRLRFINRRHTAEKAKEAVLLLQEAGYDNISIDLMFGFPEQTAEEWNNDIRQALQLNIQHISAYSLMYEEGTRLYSLLEKGNITEIDEELSLHMYRQLIEQLRQAGFVHYEISNFCLPGMHSRHNSCYWNHTPYLGLGAAAHSFNGTCRHWNVHDLVRYIEQTENGESVLAKEELTADQQYNEYIMTRLRTQEGLCLDVLKEKFGEERYGYCMENARKYIEHDELVLEQDTGSLTIFDNGLYISNQIMSDLMIV
mgnify:FL=1